MEYCATISGVSSHQTTCTSHQKTCTSCGKTQALSAFYVKRGTHISMCRSCAVAKAVAWARNNKEKRRAIWQRWLQKNKERHNAQARKWSATHPDAKRLSARAWVERNPELRKQVASEYVKRNLDKANAQWHRRRARLVGNGGSHTAADVDRIYQKQGGFCANLACRAKLQGKAEVDHVIPLILGGSDNPDNLQILCVRCNRRKHAKAPQQWARENGLLF